MSAFEEIGIDPAAVIFFLGICGTLAAGLFGAICAFVGILISKVLIFFIQADLRRIRYTKGHWQ